MSAAKRGNLSRAMEADGLFHSLKLVREARTASVRSGKQLLRTIVKARNKGFAKKFLAKVDQGASPGTYPVCLAVAAHALGIPEKSAIRMMLYSYCVSIIGPAIRLGVISHVDGQEILTRLAADANSEVPGTKLEEVWQLTPLTEIAQMQHERDEFRMFIT
jgi:urease accessory protein